MEAMYQMLVQCRSDGFLKCQILLFTVIAGSQKYMRGPSEVLWFSEFLPHYRSKRRSNS
ncbi:hypothetical protein ACP70R_001411 [Stipagrostis hirtigluma subsp. patula]